MGDNQSQRDPGLRPGIGLRSATALVIANIIGAGIFTSTGFQAGALGHPGYILLVWLGGGVLALCGALCYAELGAAIPRAGGEYVYLRESYGRSVAFMSAFVSLFAGFGAAIASALKSLVLYVAGCFPEWGIHHRLWGTLDLTDWIAVGIVWILVGIHSRGIRGGSRFNDWITLAKIAGIVSILGAALLIGRGDLSNLTWVSHSFSHLDRSDTFTAFATCLVFAMFCYSGWNASAYVAGEVIAPRKNIPRSLLLGTGIVMILYLALNLVYLYAADVDRLANKAEVGLVASAALFGPAGARLVTAVLSISLLASASAMTVAGPRVYFALGRDFAPLAALTRTDPTNGAPTPSIILQGLVTSVLILSGRVDQIQQYAGVTLILFSCLGVSCVVIMRRTRPGLARPFRVWGYPLTPLLFLGVSGWAMLWNFRARPVESTLALLTVIIGASCFHVVTMCSGAGRRCEDERPGRSAAGEKDPIPLVPAAEKE